MRQEQTEARSLIIFCTRPRANVESKNAPRGSMASLPVFMQQNLFAMVLTANEQPIVIHE